MVLPASSESQEVPLYAPPSSSPPSRRSSPPGGGAAKKMKTKKGAPGWMMVVATLLAGMAYRNGMAPERYFNGAYGRMLCATNSVAFVASLSVVMLLLTGLPFIARGVFLGILRVLMWAAFTATVLTCAISVARGRGSSV